VLGRAQTKGTTGPNLDEAFRQALRDGMPRSGIRGMVHGWILHPNSEGVMKPGIVKGQKAYDVAAYVAFAVSQSGTDPGQIAFAIKKAGGGPPAVEKAGALEIDTDPAGQLAYVTKQGRGTPGKLTIKSQNKSGTPHDIVIDGKGRGQVVTNGGVSQFSATFTPGTYTFYCSVDGHRAAGMAGKIVIK
jgi:plastocyanin